MMNDDADDMRILFETLMIRCLEHGMQPPFHMAFVAGTGACKFGRVTMAQQDGGGTTFELEPLAEHMADGNTLGRLKIMLVDPVGKTLVHHFTSPYDQWTPVLREPGPLPQVPAQAPFSSAAERNLAEKSGSPKKDTMPIEGNNIPADKKHYKTVLDIVSDALTSYLEERPVQLPVVAAMVGTNGAFLCGRFTKSTQPDFYNFEPLATHEIHGGMKVPVVVLLVDAKTGRSVHFRIE